MFVKSLKGVGYWKHSPKSHNLEGYKTRDNKGWVLAMYPSKYPMTAQQKKVRDAAKACNIHKGMSRKQLVDAMKTCLPTKF